MAIESRGQWCLFTRRDFDQTLKDWKPSDSISFGSLDDAGDNIDWRKPEGHIHADERAVAEAIGRLDRHVQSLNFEHGREGKIPRANTYRPYRLTLDGTLAAAIALRASEAFNLCEIDVFLTTEVRGLTPLEPTRAALLFAFSDAAKNAGSMAVQFTDACAPKGVPTHVRALAGRVGVNLQHADRGTLSPVEVRELFLRICGLSKQAQERVLDFAQRHFFSIERICYLVAQGLWPAYEADSVLLTSPFPDLVLGAGVNASSRHLAAQAMAYARVAILSGLVDRALRYVQPVSNEDKLIERSRYLLIGRRLDPDRLTVTHGPLLERISLLRWMPLGDAPLLLPTEANVVAFLRPRPREEIRVFLPHDLEQAGAATMEGDNSIVLLVYTDDYRQLTDEERVKANRTAKQCGVTIVACPESVAGLEAEAWRRLRVGRTVRQ